MSWSFYIGSIAGIRLLLHVTFPLALVYAAYNGGLLRGDYRGALMWVVLSMLVFVCVVLHELGHAMAARRYGIATRDILLLPIGGLARLQRMPTKPQQEIVVALAGPAVNVAIAAILFVVLRWSKTPIFEGLGRDGLMTNLLFANVLMLGFNLIPAFPMDGGRVLRAGLALWMPHVKATRIASWVGQIFAVLFGLVGYFGHNYLLVLVALFVFMAAYEERTAAGARATMAGLPVRAAMVTEFHTLDVNDPLQRAVDLMTAGSQEDFPVLDGGVPVGVLTHDDLVQGLEVRGASAVVGEVARVDRDLADLDEPLETAVRRMHARGRTALPVVQHGGLVGLITLKNVGEMLIVNDARRREGRG